MPQRQGVANNRGGQSGDLPRTKPSKAIWLRSLLEMDRPNTMSVLLPVVLSVLTVLLFKYHATLRRFHLGTAPISISVTPFGNSTSIITFLYATSPSRMSRFSMVSTCRRIGYDYTDAGKVRDQHYSHISQNRLYHVALTPHPRQACVAHLAFVAHRGESCAGDLRSMAHPR